MKRALLAGVGALGLLVTLGTRQATNAFVCANCTQELTEVMRFADQMRQGAQMLSQAQAQVARLTATYNAMTHVTDLGSAVGALNMLGLRNPLPVNPYALQGLLNGSGGAQGMLANLGGLYTGTRQANQVYRIPNVTSWAAAEINQRAAAIAGTQAVALQLHQTAAERSDRIAELQARINGAATPAEREALIARLSAEQNQMQGLTVQAIATQTYGQQQALAFDQAERERMHRSIDQVLADAKARGVF